MAEQYTILIGSHGGEGEAGLGTLSCETSYHTKQRSFYYAAAIFRGVAGSLGGALSLGVKESSHTATEGQRTWREGINKIHTKDTGLWVG